MSLDPAVSSETELLNRALEIILRGHDLERCSIFLLQGKSLVCTVGYDRSGRRLCYESPLQQPPYRFSLGEGIIGRAAQERRLVYAPRWRLDMRCLPIEHCAEGTHSEALVVAPLVVGQRLLGVFNVSSSHPNFLIPWRRRLLRFFTDLLAQKVDHFRFQSQLENTVQQRTAHLEQALTEMKALKEHYERLAAVDELTQLYNRRFFFSAASAALAQALRNREPFSLLLLDIDHFKHINDSYGHAIGDQVLQCIAAVLEQHTRHGDILARLGGEEFALMLPATDRYGAKLLADRIRQAIKALIWQIENRALHVTCSIGISSPPPFSDWHNVHSTSVRSLLDQRLKEADFALYYGKEHGRNQTHLFQALSGSDGVRECKAAPYVLNKSFGMVLE